MSYAKRNSSRNGVITPAAVEIFREGMELETRGEEESDRFSELAHALIRELQLSPWHLSPLRIGEEKKEYENDTWHAARQMRLELEAACHE